MFSYLNRNEIIFFALFIASLSALAGAWVVYTGHSQQMSYARHVNSSK